MKRLVVLIVSLAIVFMAGCGEGPDGAGEPLCDNPAPVLNEPDPDAPGVFIKLVDDVNIHSEILRLISVYDIDPEEIFEITNTFLTFVDDWTLELLRCDSVVEWVEWNSVKQSHSDE